MLENQPNNHFQQAAGDLIVDNNTVRGVVTETGIRFHADSVVLSTGTFWWRYPHWVRSKPRWPRMTRLQRAS